jgi:energy-coupling factor transporter ATP-binding protein EcfA2
MSDADSEAVTTANDDIVIAAQGLTKRYSGVSVVNAVNFDIPRGEVFGLRGPNGAGKTTTILMMLGLTDISAGTVSVLGYDPAGSPRSMPATSRTTKSHREERVMRREGSPFQGLGSVAIKELSDNLSSARMLVLELLIVLDGAGRTLWSDRQFAAEYGGRSFPNAAAVYGRSHAAAVLCRDLGFLIPLMAIGLGFDSNNSEHNGRTLSRILAQPIYRDALLMGKFLAGLTTLAISLTALWLMVIGLGLIFLGVPPGGEEVARSLTFLVIASFYAGV